MKEIFQLAISPQVLPLTVLLLPVALYWLLNLVGMLDLEFLDVDFDADGPDLNGKEGGHESWFHGALRFVNATDVPVMIVLSVLILLLWGLAMIGNLLFNAAQSGFAGGVIVLAALAGAVVLTRFVVAPLKPVFRLLRADDEKHLSMVGLAGLVRTERVDARGGQVEVEVRGAPLLLSSRAAEGTGPHLRGTEVIVISHDAATGICTVRSLSEIPPTP